MTIFDFAFDRRKSRTMEFGNLGCKKVGSHVPQNVKVLSVSMYFKAGMESPIVFKQAKSVSNLILDAGMKFLDLFLERSSLPLVKSYKTKPENPVESTGDVSNKAYIFCSIVVYPVIPRGMMLLRLIPTAVHTKEDIDITLKAFGEVAEKLNAGVYAGETVESA